MIQKYLNKHISLHYRWERFHPLPPAPPATVRTNTAGKLALWKGSSWLLLCFLDADTDASWKGAEGSGRKVLGGFMLSCWCWKLTVSWAFVWIHQRIPLLGPPKATSASLKFRTWHSVFLWLHSLSYPFVSRGPFYTEPFVKSPTMFPGVLLSRIETGSILGSQDSCIFDPLSEGGAVTSKM